jgi:hypothetical protein
MIICVLLFKYTIVSCKSYYSSNLYDGQLFSSYYLSQHFELQDSGGSASGSFEQGSNINDDVRQSTTKRYVRVLAAISYVWSFHDHLFCLLPDLLFLL